MAHHPFLLAEPMVERLAAAADVEGKLIRTLDALGPLAGRDVVLLDAPMGGFAARLKAAGIATTVLPSRRPLRMEVPDASAHAVVCLWAAFHGVEEADLAEVDRVLRPGGRLLVAHDYGRDDVSALRPPDSPEYRIWSRREGPFLRGGGFKIRVVHCFWTFETLEDAAAVLTGVFGDAGETVAGRLRRPRLSWNVAVYHRWRGGIDPSEDQPGAPASSRGGTPMTDGDGAPDRSAAAAR